MKRQIGLAMAFSSIFVAGVLSGSACTPAGPADADNTKRNERDRTTTSVTPMNQGNGKSDLDTTQAIRRAIVQLDGLSIDAKNVKIVTADGVITLRGPVKTDAERQAIVAAAQSAAGTNRLENQLEVESAR